MKQDAFPQTLRTWIGARLVDGHAGRAEVNRHLMTVYLRPLKIYFMGTSERWLGEPDDVVSGFFADRLARENFLDDWIASGLSLRRWLCNGFCFYLKELRRQKFRDGRAGELKDDPVTFSGDPEQAMDRAFVAEVVRVALAQAREQCIADGLEDHWDVFEQHHCLGRAYQDIGAEMDIRPSRAAVMTRTATKRFREALRELIARDSAHDDVDSEILALLEDD